MSFFGVGPLLDLIRTGNYHSLLTLDGFLNVCRPLMPLLLLIEIVRALIYRQFDMLNYRTTFLIYVFNRFVSRFISIAAVGFSILLFQRAAILRSSLTWYWFIYGYVIWEFAHFVYHYLAHKVRLLWCLHSTHHAPESMNLGVSYAHFFLEAPYADLIRTSICILAGVSPPTLYLIMFIDGFWGTFIHVGEHFMRDGRLGFFQRVILTPSHHRVHHARNPLYMDTNFCNLLNIWDHLLGTWQPEVKEVKIEYGITRRMNPNNFLDAYFGEIGALWRDVRRAPGLRNKIAYMVMPPGWSHTGDHHTARRIRREFLEHFHPHPSSHERTQEPEANPGIRPGHRDGRSQHHWFGRL
jgi:sterol desaturase/sphingolipid hydroxylase (fatty acid hydroxylase superfamily)